MRALRRAGRGLNPAVAAVLLLAAAFPPQAAQAQESLTLTATGGDSVIHISWIYRGNNFGVGSINHWRVQYFTGTGGGPWHYLRADRKYNYAHSNSARETTGTADLPATNGQRYAINIQLTDANGNHVFASTVRNNQGWVFATPRAQTPTLTSDPDKTVTVASADATTLVCFNLLSVKQVRGSDTLIWLQQRTGGNSYVNRLANLEGNNRVAITQAPAGIATGPGVNLFPCVTLGVGTHTVTWSWKGRDGTAVAGTTSTTVTVAVREDHGSKTITLSASPSTTITEGDAGSTDVTITFTLGQPAPAHFSLTSGYDVDGGTAAGSGKGRDPCDPPLIPEDTDLCFPNGVIVSIAEGETQGTMTVRILGDTRDEPDETLNLIGYEDGWASGKLTLTIEDDDDSTSSRTITLSASPSTTITEGDSGSTDVTVTATLGEGAPAADPDTGIFRVSLVPVSPAGTATGSNKGSDGCAPPLTPADTDWCFLAGTITFAEGETQSTKKVRILGDTRDEPNETIKLISSAQQLGWTPGTLTLTIEDDDDSGGGGSSTAPAKPVGFGATTGDRWVDLTWTNPSDASITRWEYRQKAGAGSYGSWTRITGSGATTVKHRITGLRNGTVYTFRIRAVNGNGNGAASDEVTATPAAPQNPTRPGKPTGLTATAGNARVVLRWTDPDDANITGWQLRHGKVGASLSSWSGIAGSGASTTSHTVTNLENGAAYRFLIRARNSAGNGPASDEATATPTAQSGGGNGGGNSGGGGSGGSGAGGGGTGGGGPAGGSPGGGSGNNDGGNGGSDGGGDDGGDDGDSGPGGGPKAAFTLSASCADGLCRARTGASVSFTDTSTGTVASRTWSFGDGGAGSGSRSPRHAWSAPGFYTVSLTVSDEGSTSTVSRKVLVEASDPAGSCTVDGDTRCLRESRFSVAVEWWTADGEARKAGKVVNEGTDDSGLFWFFSEANWELLLKVLDGCSLNGHVWVFGASATTLGYSIQVTDTVTGATKEYRNEPGKRSSAITDVAAFAGSCTGSASAAGMSASTPPAGTARARTTPPISTASTTRNGPVPEDDAVVALELPAVAAAESDSCTEAVGTLCLQNGRYAVSVDWTNREGDTGKGSVAPPRADDSGLFWFFSETNWELLVKVLDACTSNGHHWVFAASATDVGFDLQVRDTVTEVVPENWTGG